MEVKPGLRVVRGPDWKWSEQDGGLGCVGTLASVNKSLEEEGFAAVVQWDAGNRSNYRCGLNGMYDLRVFDSVQIGIKHPNILCDVCQTFVSGIRWKCGKCLDYDLCTICYYAGKHNMEHDFNRIDHPDSPRKQVPCRLGAKKVMAKGLFSEAVVIRGHDWIWGSQDGGEGKSGRLQSVSNQDADSLRSVAVVEWRESKTKQNYRAGYQGKVDLKCKEVASGGYFFPEHLPLLGEKEQGSSLSSGPPTHSLTVGCKVRVALDVDVFKQMQNGHGGWNDQMAETLGDVGTVSSMMDSGDVRVRYNDNHTWTVNPVVLTKADMLQQGDVIRVSNEIALVHTLQEEHGGWVDDMVLSLGQLGRVVRVFVSGDVKVRVNGKTWTYNPQCLEPAPGETLPDIEDDDLEEEDDMDMKLKLLSLIEDPAVVVAAAASGDVSTLKSFLTTHPAAVNTKAAGKTALHCAAVSGNVDMVKTILEYHPDLEIPDEDGDSPLHLSAYSDEDQIATMLIEAGAKVNARNNKEVTPLVIAAVKGHVSVVRVLVAQTDIRLSDQDADGDTALHCAVLAQKYESVSVLLEAGADPTLLNFRLFTPIHEAAKIGFLPAMELFVRKFPHHINLKKEDGFTPLHLSAFNDHLDTLTSLLEDETCDMNAKIGDGRTAMHLAVDRGHFSIVERLVGYGCNLDMTDKNGNTPLHLAVGKSSEISGLTNETPQMKKVLESLALPKDHSDLSHAVVAGFLVREGANIYVKNQKGHTPLQTCDSDVSTAITAFTGSTPTFHNSMRIPALSTLPVASQSSQSLHYSMTMHPPRGIEVGVPRTATAPASLSGPKDFTDDASSARSAEKSSSDDEKDICFMCDTNVVNTKFEPCGHSVMCEEDAHRARRCSVCKKKVTGVVLLKAKCAMCRVDEATVTVLPCKHKFCPGCATRMRMCFECRVQIEFKEGLPAEKPPDNPSTSASCPICLTEPKNTAFLCGHQLCWECSQKVDSCPVCRKFVTHRIRLFQ